MVLERELTVFSNWRLSLAGSPQVCGPGRAVGPCGSLIVTKHHTTQEAFKKTPLPTPRLPLSFSF